jgi:outer membrane protein insertion porin family
VRSFQLDGMAPRDEDGDPIGGQLYWQLNLEAQIPVFGPFYAVGFVDFGNLAPEWREAAISETRVAPGLGMRLYTPIGAVYVDYGYNLVRKDGDPVGAVQFGFGFTF